MPDPYQSNTGDPKSLGETPDYTAKKAGSNIRDSRLNKGSDTNYKGTRKGMGKSGKMDMC